MTLYVVDDAIPTIRIKINDQSIPFFIETMRAGIIFPVRKTESVFVVVMNLCHVLDNFFGRMTSQTMATAMHTHSQRTNQLVYRCHSNQNAHVFHIGSGTTQKLINLISEWNLIFSSSVKRKGTFDKSTRLPWGECLSFCGNFLPN